MTDSLGSRMKEQYEDRTRYLLPRRTYTIVRVDGKAFHTHLATAERPFDRGFMNRMDYTMYRMAHEMHGCQFGYTQSDEISLLLTDFRLPETSAWFDGCVQKIASVSAALATAHYNRCLPPGSDIQYASPVTFDARVFTIPDHIEVANYFVWRQQDATRNSLSMAAQSLYSHKELHGKKTPDLHDLLHAKGINWNDYTEREKRGAVVQRSTNGWVVKDPPIFTQNPQYLRDQIPMIWEEKRS